jgi:hypothetical protein
MEPLLSGCAAHAKIYLASWSALCTARVEARLALGRHGSPANWRVGMARFLDQLLPLKCQRRRFDAATQKQGRHLKKTQMQGKLP